MDKAPVSVGPGRLFVVSGPSGSGKSTLCRAAVARTQARLSISATTRPRGKDEVEGKDYYFLSEKEFTAKVKAGDFLEHARVFDHYYGTPAGPVKQMLAAGETVVLEIDVQGAAQVFKNMPEAIGILILPPDMEELCGRLCRRGRDDESTINKRLSKAQWEIEQARAHGQYRHTIVNDDLNEAIAELAQWIG
jgi:guanylate kinase